LSTDMKEMNAIMHGCIKLIKMDSILLQMFSIKKNDFFFKEHN